MPSDRLHLVARQGKKTSKVASSATGAGKATGSSKVLTATLRWANGKVLAERRIPRRLRGPRLMQGLQNGKTVPDKHM
jgi:hypothetical protein